MSKFKLFFQNVRKNAFNIMFWAPLANWGFVIAGNFRIFKKSYTTHNNDNTDNDDDNDNNDDNDNDDNDNDDNNDNDNYYQMLCQKLAKHYYCVQLRT
ncbi:hypothetical protein [Plasmodium yoelii yoelii]|uniref:Mitochondrial pyruvate carrier protein 1 n=2 Tax=Plasmodium yoelii yoelii TaxID=73239 RepID=A0AAF0B7B7_PLAYO|nr:hypothetical protein [Plasmodium yoelii yoelii]WBY60329.1 mitochondrial pyruvate carrier protein 1 [Plasmodium yoelii yoelii]